MVKRRSLFIWLIAFSLPEMTLAQWRENQPPVVTPQESTAPAKPDYSELFRRQYAAAGSPRIVLFWNVSFDDQIEASSEQLDTTVKNSSSSGQTITRRTLNRAIDPAKRPAVLSERSDVQLQTTLIQRLRLAGVNLLDRAALMRATQIGATSTSIDAKRIEAEAVIRKSDLLMEVLFIPDSAAPLGSGFKVSVKNIKLGTEVMSLYTLAAPEVAPVPGQYVAKDGGFEWKQPTPIAATVAEVGNQLAEEILKELSGSKY